MIIQLDTDLNYSGDLLLSGFSFKNTTFMIRKRVIEADNFLIRNDSYHIRNGKIANNFPRYRLLDHYFSSGSIGFFKRNYNHEKLDDNENYTYVWGNYSNYEVYHNGYMIYKYNPYDKWRSRVKKGFEHIWQQYCTVGVANVCPVVDGICQYNLYL